MRRPWEIDWSDPNQVRTATQRPTVLRGPPREPPAQTQAQATRDAFEAQQGPIDAVYRSSAEARAAQQSTRLPDSVMRDLTQDIDAFAGLHRAVNGFQRNYSGFGSGLENTAQSYLGTGTPGQRNWWAEFYNADNVARNRLFGASLSEGEQAAYQRTTISPNMRAEEVEANIASRMELARSALRRRVDALRAQGYNNEAIDAMLGDYRALLDQSQGSQQQRRGQVVEGPRIGIFGDEPDPNAGRGLSQDQEQQIFEAIRTSRSLEELESRTREITGGWTFANSREIFETMQRGGNIADNIVIRPPDISDARGGSRPMSIADFAFAPFGGREGAYAAGRGVADTASLGTADEIMAAAYSRLGSGSYEQNLARERAINAYDFENNFGQRLTGQVAGGALLPVPGSSLGRSALAGAGYGAAYGAGSATEGNRLVGAAAGGATGAALGTAIPIFADVTRNTFNMGRRILGGGRNAASTARQTISDAIEADANTPSSVGQQMEQARANGVPYMLADSGDNVRGLLAASSRAPGRSRTMVRDALDQRQGGLADRVSGAVERDLGPASNPHLIRDEMMREASTAAAPIYRAAYARPGADTFYRRVRGLFEGETSRPSMTRAMARARELAREEGVDPTTLGFDINEAGETIIARTPSWQTLDYVKRGLDDVLEGYRNETTGRLDLDTLGRAVNNTRSRFLGLMNKANPELARARVAWAGPTQATEAMDLGLRALDMTADDMAARTRDFGESQLEFFRLGVRRAMVERVASRGDTADVVHALVGTGKKRAMLARLFGGRQEFDRFAQTLQAEQEGFRTFNQARLGSPTAPNLADDQALQQAIGAGVDVATGGGLGIATALREAAKFGVGRSGNQTREQLAALLSETDPSRLRELARELNREAARRGAARRKRRYVSGQVGRATTGQILAPVLDDRQ